MRYNDFNPMESRRDSVGCLNGADHRITKGQIIGWSRRHRVACCEPCWSKWTTENREAELYEANLPF